MIIPCLRPVKHKSKHFYLFHTYSFSLIFSYIFTFQQVSPHGIIAAKEKQAPAKQAFVFHAALTSKRPMKSGMKR